MQFGGRDCVEVGIIVGAWGGTQTLKGSIRAITVVIGYVVIDSDRWPGLREHIELCARIMKLMHSRLVAASQDFSRDKDEPFESPNSGTSSSDMNEDTSEGGSGPPIGMLEVLLL